MIEISLKRANQIDEEFRLGTSNIKAIEMSYTDGIMYMTVSSISGGIIEYKIVDKPINKTVEIREYTDCFMASINDKNFIFDGLSEPEKLINLLKELGIESKHEEIAREIFTVGNLIK